MDKNHNGEVDLDGLLDMVKTFGLKKIDEADWKIVLECLDLDKDGKVGYEDLQNLLFQELEEIEN